MTLASFDWLQACCPEYLRSPCKSSKPILPMAWAPEDTVTIRAGALALSRSSSRSVSRNGARWLTAKVCSSPSAVTCRVAQNPPTLLTRTSRRGYASRTSRPSRRTSAWDDMSAAIESTAGLPEAAAMSAAAACARTWSRPTMPTRAPSAARPRAVALPIPPVPPVTSTVLPAIGPVMLSAIADSLSIAEGMQGWWVGGLPPATPRQPTTPRRSTNDLEVEHRGVQHAHQPQPDRQYHLRAASGGDVTEVNDVGVTEGLQQADHGLLRLCVVAGHEHRVVAVGNGLRVDHQRRRQRVESLDDLQLVERGLDLLTQRIGVLDEQGGRKALRGIEGVGDVKENPARQVLPAGRLQHGDRHVARGGVDDHLGAGGRLGEGRERDVGVSGRPRRVGRVAHAVGRRARHRRGNVAGADGHVVTQLGQPTRLGLTDHPGAQHCDLHRGCSLQVSGCPRTPTTLTDRSVYGQENRLGSGCGQRHRPSDRLVCSL